MRADKERKEAIEKLKANKEVCAEFNFFWFSNHRAIDVMIDVINEKRTEDFIYKHYKSVTPEQHEDFTSAINALEYLRGELEIEDLLYPVSNG